MYLRSQKCWDIRQKAPDARRMSAALLGGMQANATRQMGLFGRIEQRWGVFRYTLDFRATKDIDLVLIIEAVDVAFGRKFWDYVKQAGYEHCNKSSGVPQFYRFSHPTSNRYPAMIELFTRKLDAIQLPDDAVLTPLPMDEDVSSLSAILLDDDYYEFLKQGKVTVDGVTVLGMLHI